VRVMANNGNTIRPDSLFLERVQAWMSEGQASFEATLLVSQGCTIRHSTVTYSSTLQYDNGCYPVQYCEVQCSVGQYRTVEHCTVVDSCVCTRAKDWYVKAHKYL